MRLAITGASGYLGRQLIPRFLDRNVDLVLIGRDPDLLRADFPTCRTTSYINMQQSILEFDIVLHLSVINNDRAESREVFKRVNTDLALDVCRIARLSGVQRFIFLSSTHALNKDDLSHYAESKRETVRALLEVEGMQIQILYLPAVTGETLAGRLAVLNRLPRFLRRVVVQFLGLIRLTVSIDEVAKAILGDASQKHRAIVVRTVGGLGAKAKIP